VSEIGEKRCHIRPQNQQKHSKCIYDVNFISTIFGF